MSDRMAEPAESHELERRFLAALPDIEAAVRFVTRRNHVGEAEAEEFAGEVRLAFVQDDYRILRRFEGRSSLRTYVIVVVQRLFLDHRQKMWGKWRPSTAARRRGALACQLEALMFRDRLTPEEAVESLRTNQRVGHTRQTLLEIAAALPARTKRRLVGEDALASLPDSADPEAEVAARALGERAQAVIARVFETFTAEDRLVLRLRFEDDLPIADIARALRVDQKQLYRRVEKLLGRLRLALESSGLTWHALLGMIEAGQCHFCLPRVHGEIAIPGPSNAAEGA